MKSDVEKDATIFTSEHFAPLLHYEEVYNDDEQSLKQSKDNSYSRENSGDEENRNLLDESCINIQSQTFPGFISFTGFQGKGLVMVDTSSGQAINKFNMVYS